MKGRHRQLDLSIYMDLSIYYSQIESLNKRKRGKEEGAPVCGSRTSNLFMQHGQHFGEHVTGFHGGQFYRCSSGGDVALSCCHIDASQLTITQLEVSCTFAPFYSRLTRNHQIKKHERRKIVVPQRETKMVSDSLISGYFPGFHRAQQ